MVGILVLMWARLVGDPPLFPVFPVFPLPPPFLLQFGKSDFLGMETIDPCIPVVPLAKLLFPGVPNTGERQFRQWKYPSCLNVSYVQSISWLHFPSSVSIKMCE